MNAPRDPLFEKMLVWGGFVMGTIFGAILGMLIDRILTNQ